MSKKVLVIGSGPSGIFTCGALSTDKSIDVKVLVATKKDIILTGVSDGLAYELGTV